MNAASKHDGPVRRSNHVTMPVAYAAVGASNAPDLLRFPPEGSTPFEEALKLGSGQDRFITASSLLMTWGAQRGAGFEVVDIVPGDGGRYSGVSFDPSGAPTPAPDSEDSFGPDGEPYLTAGTRATVRRGKDRGPRSMLVLYTVDESRRVGFAWGHVDEEGAVGEQLFTVEYRTDDTVWAVARGFLSVPKGGLLGLKTRNLLKTAIADAKEQLTSLAPGSAGAAGAGAAASAEGTDDPAGGAEDTSGADEAQPEIVIDASAQETEDSGAREQTDAEPEATDPDPNEPVTAVIVGLPFAAEADAEAEAQADAEAEIDSEADSAVTIEVDSEVVGAETQDSAEAEEPVEAQESAEAEEMAEVEEPAETEGTAEAEEAAEETGAANPHRRRPQGR